VTIAEDKLGRCAVEIVRKLRQTSDERARFMEQVADLADRIAIYESIGIVGQLADLLDADIGAAERRIGFSERRREQFGGLRNVDERRVDLLAALGDRAGDLGQIRRRDVEVRQDTLEALHVLVGQQLVDLVGGTVERVEQLWRALFKLRQGRGLGFDAGVFLSRLFHEFG